MDHLLILIHAFFGGLALLSGSIAMVAAKGKKWHRMSGKVFFYAMLLSALLALVIALMPGHFNPFLFSIGVFTTYLLTGGYRALQFRKPVFQLPLDIAISMVMLVCGIGMILVPLLFHRSLDIVLTVFGSIGISFSIRDLLLYQNLERLKHVWLRLHIGKMTGAYIAALTAFLVVNQLFVYYLNWLLPTVLGTIYITYWRKRMAPQKSAKTNWLLIAILFTSNVSTDAQVYLEKQTRHRFAQLTLGLDYQSSFGGQTSYSNASGDLLKKDLQSTSRPRLIIGGTHFWGHADFYIAIPLFTPSFQSEGLEATYTSGVETVFKYYPWRITDRRVRPYVGLSLAPFYFQQNQQNDQVVGPGKQHFTIPVLAGITYQHKQYLVEFGLNYNYANEINYYLSRTTQAAIQTPPLYLYLSFKYSLETTFNAEKPWESGQTERVTQALAEQGKLNNFFFGVAMSSAWWLGNSSYNQSQRPFMEGYGTSLMPDFSVGYYWHRPDFNVAINYRGYRGSTNAYGVQQSLTRKSVGLEITKFLGDYHGFVPFIGPIISYEDLSFRERVEQDPIQAFENQKLGYGIVFGWDIRPNRIQQFILRTNLRWYPNLNLNVAAKQRINFSNLEFNFIQFVCFPGRW